MEASSSAFGTARLSVRRQLRADGVFHEDVTEELRFFEEMHASCPEPPIPEDDELPLPDGTTHTHTCATSRDP